MRAYQKQVIEKSMPLGVQEQAALDNIDKTMCWTNYTSYPEWVGDVAKNCERDFRFQPYALFDILAWLDKYIRESVPTRWTR
jgi:hypothetical protein